MALIPAFHSEDLLTTIKTACSLSSFNQYTTHLQKKSTYVFVGYKGLGLDFLDNAISLPGAWRDVSLRVFLKVHILSSLGGAGLKCNNPYMHYHQTKPVSSR